MSNSTSQPNTSVLYASLGTADVLRMLPGHISEYRKFVNEPIACLPLIRELTTWSAPDL